MKSNPMGKPLLAPELGLLGALAIGVLTGCGGRQPSPPVQSSPTSSPPAASPSASLSPTASPSPSAKLSQSPEPSVSPSVLNLPAEQKEEALAQLSLLSLTSGQQAWFSEKKEFAPSIAALDKKWKPLEKYDVAMKPEGKQKLTITAKAKDTSLKSYTAVLYGFEDANVASVTCGTLSPSQTPPVLAAPPPQSPKEPVFCPPGTYRSDGAADPALQKKS